MVDKATAIIGFYVAGAAALQQLASWFGRRKMEQIHVIVNSQRTEMLQEIAWLKAKIARLMPDDPEAQTIAEAAAKEVKKLRGS